VAGVLNLLRSRVGRAWVAIRDNDISAEVMGINVVQYKLIAFFVAGFIGGVAGAFWISNLAAISPEHFPLVLVPVAGGRHPDRRGRLDSRHHLRIHLHGGGDGAAADGVIPLASSYPKLLMDFLFIKEAAFGLAICAFMIFEPNGLAYRWWQPKIISTCGLFPIRNAGS
jgi:branched-chain amino acid transport system permease protein